jgi:hypothetical protein
MFLIQYGKNDFINAEKIDCIGTANGVIKFTTDSNQEGSFAVSEEFKDKFLSQITALNTNICCELTNSKDK